MIVSSNAFAQRCVAQGDGRTWGDCSTGGGGGPSSSPAAPVYQGPSPAEIAARRQRAAALALDTRAHAAFDRGDLDAAVRDFEEAAKLAPNDNNIQGNRWYTKGKAAYRQDDFETAVAYFRQALKYFPENKSLRDELKMSERDAAADRGDWDSAIQIQTKFGNDPYAGSYLQYLRGRKALANEQWDVAVTEFKQREAVSLESKRKLESSLAILQTSLLDLQKDKSGEAQTAQRFTRQTIPQLQHSIAENEARRTREHKFLEMALAGKARQEEGRKVEEQRRQQQSNPNYPGPPPVYRDANTPRTYPKLESYSETQRKAHADNEMGNVWAEKGDWAQALMQYQQALNEDPDGPFAFVLKGNIAIATKHLDESNGKRSAPPAAAPSTPPKEVQQSGDKPKEAADANCTGWMTQAGGAAFRLCTDERGQRYCEQSDGNSASRVSCQ